MTYMRLPFSEMSGTQTRPTQGLAHGRGQGQGQQLHVSGVFIIVLELALVVENLMPVLVVVLWLPPRARSVSDRLMAAFSITCILSALVPTPLGLASYFSGGWYGGESTCTTYQVTSSWVNLSSLAMLTYISVNCNLAVRKLARFKRSMTACNPNLLAGRTRSPSYQPSLIWSENIRSSSIPHSKNIGNSSSCHLQNVTSQERYSCKSNTHPHGNNCLHASKALGDESQFVVEEENECSRFDADHSGRLIFDQVTDSDVEENSKITSGRNRDIRDADLPLGNRDSGSRARFEPSISDVANEACAVKQTALRISYNDRPEVNGVAGSDSCNHETDLSRLNAQAISQTTTQTDYQTSEAQVKPNGEVERVDSNYGQIVQSPSTISNREGSCCGPLLCRARDFVSLALFLLYTVTLIVSSLPVLGFGPQLEPSETMCRSWIVPTPTALREKTFFIVFLVFVYFCLLLGCGSAASVCFQVSRRMRKERKRKSRLYHEEEDVPDLLELSVLDDMKRHYGLTCIVLAGLLTWTPILLMLTLQKSGVAVSEATLMYSHIATSLPGLLNPLLYSLVLSRYRAGYKAVMDKCCCRKRKQTQHSLTEVHCHPSCPDLSTDTTMTITSDGRHSCIHGTPNPNYLCSMADVDGDNEEEEEDEDYFPDDGELLSTEAQDKMAPKLNERTPLQAQGTSQGPIIQALRSGLSGAETVSGRNSWTGNHHYYCCHHDHDHHHPHHQHYLDDDGEEFICGPDTECLLTSNFIHEETGL